MIGNKDCNIFFASVYNIFDFSHEPISAQYCGRFAARGISPWLSWQNVSDPNILLQILSHFFRNRTHRSLISRQILFLFHLYSHSPQLIQEFFHFTISIIIPRKTFLIYLLILAFLFSPSTYALMVLYSPDTCVPSAFIWYLSL